MIRRHWPIWAFGLFLLALGLNLQAQTPATPPKAAVTPAPTSDFSAKELTARQQAIEQQYKAFTLNLLSLARKLKASSRVEDQDKAKTLEKAIELADKEGVDNKFTMLLRTISKNGDLGINDITKASGQQDDIIKVMSAILAILQSDDELARIKAEKEALEKHLADLNGLIRGEKIVQARTDSGKGDPNQIAKEQKKLAEETAKLAERMGAKKDDPKDGSGKPKDGSGKPGDPKDGSGKPKDGDPKDGSGKPKDGDPKDGSGKPKDGDPKDGSGKPKDGSGKPSDPKDGSGKPKDGSGKPSDPKDGSGKPKDGSGKPSDPKDGSGKPSDPKDGSGQPKDGSGQPKDGSGSPMPPSPPSPSKPQAPGADSVKKAVPDEQNASDNLDKDNRKDASDNQAKAIDKMEEARKELEKRLKQLREQELERLLANLEQRVGKMLAMQIEVKAATVTIDGQVLKNPDMKPRPVDFQNAQKQEDRETEIIVEADKAIELLRNEGSAVAFPAVFEEVRQDMVRVKERLHNANVGEDTQALEQDIITVLTQMKEALKKAQQELGKQPPMPPWPSQVAADYPDATFGRS